MFFRGGWFGVLLGACAGAAPPAESAAPEPPPPTTPAKPIRPESAAETAKPAESDPPTAAVGATPREPAPEAATPASAPSRRPTEILTGPTVAFILDYQASTPYETAESACDADSKGDSAARADCMQKARGDFKADVLHFKKEAGRWWLIVYQRQGSSLPEVYKVSFEFADEKHDSVTLRLKDGGTQGARPFFAGNRQIQVSLPDDYSIRLSDPKLGQLVYKAKVGLVGK